MEIDIDALALERFGIAHLQPYQRLVVTGILETLAGESRVQGRIVLLPTGAGKSLCFSIPAVVAPRMSLLVYPLVSLLNDQLRRLRDVGIRVDEVRGGQSREARRAVLARIAAGVPQCVLTNPETLVLPPVRTALRRGGVAHLVIDEAHCVSEWGDTFRPAYLTLGESITAVAPTAVTAFTATASPRIMERITEVVFSGDTPRLVRGNPDRPTISYRALPVLHRGHALRSMFAAVTRGAAEGPDPPIWKPGDPVRLPAIIFCRSRADTAYYAGLIAGVVSAPVEVMNYHAGLPSDHKRVIEERFFGAEDAVLAATCAYGLGVDKPNVRTVIHTYLPETVEAFLQESGRGGRDREPAQSITLVGPDDRAGRARFDEAAAAPTAVQTAMTGTSCRREALLAALSWESDGCTGCDVCEGSAITSSAAESALLAALPRMPLRASLHDWSGHLAGRPTTAQVISGTHRAHGAGLLNGWQAWEIESVIEGLEDRGLVRRRRGRLTVTPLGRARPPRAARRGYPSAPTGTMQ